MESSSLSNPISCKEKKKKRCAGRPKLSTDPQSVAARQRRHRISDRFKILQSLVPGGSKLDTVSMLEEAIQYVKFLKAQIWLHQAMLGAVDDDTSSTFAPNYKSSVVTPVVDGEDDRNNYSGDPVDVVGPEFGRPVSWFFGEGNH